MPGKVKVKIIAGRNLPVMDRSSDTTDAYVEIKLGNTSYKTDVCRKSLNPQWNSEWYRFEMDDAELQDEPLQIRLMDHDTYSANDAIGKVYIDLNPLLLPSSTSSAKSSLLPDSTTASSSSISVGNTMSGWFPVYDTMHGIRGEVNIIVKVELFSDFNKFRQSSCGVQFFNSSVIPQGYHAQVIHGLVEELIVSDDPEYQWIDKIRTPRASNEARQTIFLKLSGEVQRKIGLKVLDLGGNAVIGYKQCFDLEGESGIVVRGIGTAATLIRLYEHIHASRPTMTTEESSVNINVDFLNTGILPVLSVIPASPSPYHSYLPSTTKKKILVPKSPKPIHSSSPNRWQPFSKNRSNNKNLGLSTHSLNIDIFDNFSVKSLCDQEDMRGEVTSNRKKLFRAISEFPRKRIKALKSNSADGFSFNKRKPKTYACSTALIKSIIDSKNFLDSVSEREEPIDNNRMDDSGSVYLEDERELMRFVDGHLESEGSSLSTDSSSSDVDISDMSSVNISGTEIVPDIDSEQEKCSNKLSKVESFCNSTSSSTKCNVDSGKKDCVVDTGNPTDCSDFTIESKNSVLSGAKKLSTDSYYIVRKVEDSENRNSPLDVHVKSQLIDDENMPKSFSKLVEFKETSSLGKAQRNVSLQRQNCFDNSFKGRSRYIHRSDTPPLSEMDPYMKFSLDDNMTYTETIFIPQSTVKVTVTQPSFDKKSKSKSAPNLNQSESRVDPEMNVSSNINNGTGFKTVHTVDFSSRNLHVGSDLPYPIYSNFKRVSNKNATCSDMPNAMSFAKSTVENKQQNKSVKPIMFSKMNPELRDQIIIPLKDPDPEYENLLQDRDYIQNVSQSENEQFDLSRKQILDHDLPTNRYEFPSSIPDDEDHMIIPLKEHEYDNKYITNESDDTRQTCDPMYKEIVNLSYNARTFSANKLTYKQVDSVVIPLKNADCVQESIHDPNNFAPQHIFDSNSEQKFDDHNENKFFFHKPNSDQTDCIWIPLKVPEDDNAYSLCQNQNLDYVTKIDFDSQQKDYCESFQNPDDCLYERGQKHYQDSSAFKCNANLEIECSSKPVLSFEPELSPQIPSVIESLNLTANINSNMNCSAKFEQCFEVVMHSAADNTLPASVANQANLNVPHDPCLVKSHSDCGLIEPCQSSFPPSRSVPEDVTVQQQSSGPTVSVKTSQSPARATISTSIHRRSSDSDLSITPKGNSLTGSDRSSVAGTIARPLPSVFLRPSLYKEASDSLEYPFLTMSKYPPSFILHLGGLIQSRSVKLLERMTNIEEPESRDSWWSELRLEIRSHARALSCNIVLGYSEHTAICDDVCVLSASGTAAVVSIRPSEVSSLNSNGVAANLSDTPEGPAIVILPKQFSNLTTSIDRPDYERQAQTAQIKQEGSSGSGKQRHHSDSIEAGTDTNILPCNPCHLPYNVKKMPYSVDAPKCGICRKARVPDVMYCTIEPPDNIPVAGQCCLLQAFVCRPKRDCRAELNAKEISDALPFLEYELHSQLLNKLRVSGMNSVFGLKVQICLGEKMIGALATGTGVLLAALPPPPAPVVTPGNAFQDDQKLAEIQKKLQESIKQNRDYYQLRTLFNANMEGDTGAAISDTEESEDDLPEPDLTTGNKDACILVIDDAEDADVITRLIDPLPPDGFHVSATESLPGLEDLGVVRNLQMFTQIWRSKIPPTMPLSSYNKHFHKLLQGVYFKLRRMVPCAIGNVRFLVEMPEPEEMQISLVGMALGLAETERMNRPSRKKLPSLSSSKDMSKKDDPEMIFCLEEDQESSGPVTASAAKPLRSGSPVRSEKKKPKHVSLKEHYGVDITTLSFIPGARIERYVGNLNFFFIRESTSVREGGGLSGFVHSFVAEVLAIVRAHITALGGNAMVAYSMCDCILHNNPHKNNGQCLVNVVGDAVYVSYPQE